MHCEVPPHFNGHFPGKPELAVCLLDSQSSVIFILGQVKTLHPFLLSSGTQDKAAFTWVTGYSYEWSSYGWSIHGHSYKHKHL